MGKCDEDIRIHVPGQLKNDLFRLAEQDGRTLSDYVRYLLELHAYGHRKKILGEARGTGREYQGTSVPNGSDRIKAVR